MEHNERGATARPGAGIQGQAARTDRVAVRRGPVLVTGIDLPDGDMMVRLLTSRGEDVHGSVSSDHDATNPGITTHRTPPVTNPGYVPHLVRTALKHRIGVIIPTSVDELPALAAARGAFGPSVHASVATPLALAICADRWLTAQQLTRRGVGTPRSAVPSQFDGPDEARRVLGGPVVVRPRRGPRSRLLGEDPASWHELGDDVTLQEFIPGPGHRVLVHRPEGRSRARRSVTVLDSDGVLGGLASDGDTVAIADAELSEDVQRAALAAVRAVGVTGPSCVDVRRAATGTPVVLAVHARICRHVTDVPAVVDAILEETRVRANTST